ncbi:MAG: DUF4386 domain-containing protein [Actinomycetia bacterium]|nr:DUF4386 domain-containing protein [Actinomycetes bacterium]
MAIFANFFVREGLVVADDAAATAANIAESEGLFRLGLVSFLMIFLLDVVVAWALHIVFRDTNRDLSRLSAWFRLTYTVLLGVATLFFFQALQLLSGADFLSALGSGPVEAQALVALETFNSAWLIGLAAFGVHLALLGVLVVQAAQTSRALGRLLVIAGVAYLVDTGAHALLGNYADYEGLFTTIVVVPAVIAELWLGLWLFLRGGGHSA